jgi:hypothetical protein
MKVKELQTEVSKALENAMTYTDFKELVFNSFEEGRVTGHTQSEDLLNYTQLNLKRIKRWDKTLKVDEALADKVAAFQKKVFWIVVAEGWCGDVAHSLPAINKLAELNENIELKIVLRDDNSFFIDHFLTNGARSIPKLVMVDQKTLEVLGVWGERPTPAKKLITDYKAAHGQVDATVKEELQRWYNQDKGKTVMKELSLLLA